MNTPKACVVIDVEATCWEKEPEKQRHESEIIEFGITVISLPDKKLGESHSILVKPARSEISSFCTQLTSITPEMVEEDGVSFHEAIDTLERDFKVTHSMWASWGCYDRDAILRQCKREWIKSPFNNQHLNVKSAFSWKYGFSCGMECALRHMKMPLVGTHHRGVDDSRNIAKILLAL